MTQSISLEEGVARLEGLTEQIGERLPSLEARIKVQITITIAMWVTTMLAVLSTLVAVLLRT